MSASAAIEYASDAPVPLFPRLHPHHLAPDKQPDYLKLILTSKVYEILKETPLVPAPLLSAKLGCEIWLKREDLQEVFSFKIRGAYNFMAHLPEEDRWKGVVTCSAGNHAQGVALSGAKLNIPCTIVMPHGTPSIKVRNVQRLGARVVLHGADFDAAKAECARLAQEHGLTFVPPYDDPLVVAGQGTVGMEILKQLNRAETLDGVFAAVGGGGLVAGIAEYVKRIGNPRTKVIGGETFDGDAMDKSLKAGERVTLPEVGPFSDGTAVKIVGEEPFRICKNLLDGIVKVDNDELCAAIKDIFEETRSVTEPAGALGLASLKRYVLDNDLVGSGKRFVAVVSGANMNFDRLRFVAERAELGEGREALFSVEIPEHPGTFFALHNIIHPRTTTEFIYRYNSYNAPADVAHIFISFYLQTTSWAERPREIAQVLETLEQSGMKGVDISEDEMAKSHARYMVGGCAAVENERVFRFEFPERPNALRNFLLGLKSGSQSGWNISLFHYRNHGADMGKVLAGIQVPPAEHADFDKFLDTLGYHYVEETENPVYRRYLLAPSGSSLPNGKAV
ncbi:threonine ammonia-lyase [Coniophora puteana RWD-64-598 SS2]|uniref:Threonine dehydratase n=1 Tax=Coniophora puteana (strain RWD-64-598) TaxID=741705 RepID=A0A5M3MW00_CONPW|nr:threonine ammonia-lyase [Coniophora puteana RWD-64-598 SS2]EIW83342.1 threonine ammonia-lyase [Coniophora puteana RWD-64-598 SS2]